MFLILYRWRIKKGMEQEFVDAWSQVTAYIRENFGSLGQCLHRDGEGIFYGYPQWKSAEQRKNVFSAMPDLEAGRKMRASIEETLPEIVLENLSDYLILPGSK